MAKLIRWAIGEDGKWYNVENFKSKAEAHSQKYYDEYGHEVTPVLSNKVQSHFRRIDGVQGGPGGPMSDVHNLTQDSFLAFFKSKYPIYVSYWDWDKHQGKCHAVKFDLKTYYNQCEKEKTIDGLRADILVWSDCHPEYPPILVEVLYTHACDLEKINSGHLIIEIRVDNKDDIKHALRNINESYLNDINPKVRFHNFRENREKLPWIKE